MVGTVGERQKRASSKIPKTMSSGTVLRNLVRESTLDVCFSYSCFRIALPFYHMAIYVSLLLSYCIHVVRHPLRKISFAVFSCSSVFENLSVHGYDRMLQSELLNFKVFGIEFFTTKFRKVFWSTSASLVSEGFR